MWSVRRTGRLIVVDESHPRCSLASDIAAPAGSEAFYDLKAPVRQVTAPHAPVPCPVLEDAYIPSAQRICNAVHQVMAGRS